MKRIETFFKSDRKYAIIMLLCFIYGGFSIIYFLFQAYASFWIGSITEANFNDFNVNEDSNDFKPRGGGGGFRLPRDPFMLLVSPFGLSYLIGGIISIMAGISILNLTRKKEIKKVKEIASQNLLLPDEKALVEALKDSDYELTQSKLVKETGLTKVQVHRALKKLEAKELLKKHEYGLTNKIILKKEIFE